MLRRTPLRPKPRKRATKAERNHMERVAERGCIICAAPCEIHHITKGEGGRITRTHSRVVGLCPAHHRTGPDSVHTLGQDAFDATHGINLLTIADHLWSEINA